MKAGALLATGALLAAFVAVGGWALAARLGRDAYAPYTSLRTDAAGTSLFFDALARTGVAVARDYDGSGLGREPAAVTRFYVAPGAVSPTLAAALFAFVRRGGRLVWLAPALPLAPPRPPAPIRRLEPPRPPAPPTFVPPDFWRWFAIAPHGYAHRGTFLAAPAPPPASAPVSSAAWPLDPRDLLRQPLPVATDGYLEPAAPGWIAVFTLAGHPVLLTRRLGRGSVVVASDAAFLGNARLRAAPHSPLLLWLVGGRRRVVVDETAHGLANRRGLAWLFARYRLRAGLAALLLLLGLALWRLAPSLLPPLAESPAGAALAAESARQGYIRLLRRAIPPRNLLAACSRESGAADDAPTAADAASILAAYNARYHA